MNIVVTKRTAACRPSYYVWIVWYWPCSDVLLIWTSLCFNLV